MPDGDALVWSCPGAVDMRLTEIRIDRPGLWHDFKLPVPSNGLSVFYGPNEAGKTTLRQFIAGVLFGVPQAGDQSAVSATGSLEIEDATGRRRLYCGETGTSAPKNQPQPDGLPSAKDRQIFERIFATGLSGLSELESLSS